MAAPHTSSIQRAGMVVLWVAIAVLGSAGQARAATAGSGISQGYQAASSVLAGELVSLAAGTQQTVTLASTSNVSTLVGVVQPTAAVALSNGSSNIQVSSSGTVSTYVSDLNGVVHAGDRITASRIDGIGMKATASGEVVGTAQADLTSVRTVPFTTTTAHRTQTVHIGIIPVHIAVSYYGGTTSGQTSSIVPGALQRIANAIAGREVSVMRVLVCLLIILLGFMSTAIILYTSVKSGITSVGRNPLAAPAIHTSLLQVLLVVMGVMVAMVVGAYVVLAT